MRITSLGRQAAGRWEVIYIGNETVVALVLGVAMLVIAVVGLVIKLIELGRR